MKMWIWALGARMKRPLTTLALALLIILSLFLVALALFLLLAGPVDADTLYLPLVQSGLPGLTVTGQLKWGPPSHDSEPVVDRVFVLMEVLGGSPPDLKVGAESPRARSDAGGRFVFEGVENGRYVLGIESPGPEKWALVWKPDEGILYLVEVKGESVEMGTVRVGIDHLWGESDG